MHRLWLRSLLPLLLAAQVSAAAEQTLPDIHAHEWVTSLSTDAAGPTGVSEGAADLDHGHAHACHCVHQHGTGVPEMTAQTRSDLLRPEVPTLSGARSDSRSLRPPFRPPRLQPQHS